MIKKISLATAIVQAGVVHPKAVRQNYLLITSSETIVSTGVA